jgi:energy-coupling factor transporter transmembrane protein EcfT
MQPPPGGWPPPQQGYAPRPEITFFQGRGVTITSARVIVPSATYPLAAITSIHTFITPKPSGPLIIALMVACVGALACLGGTVSSVLFGILLLGAGALIFVSYMRSKNTHFVKLRMASGEANAVASTDVAFVQAVIAALNHAIVNRG